MDVYVNGKKVRADPKRAIGKGGEADVFDIGRGQALKLFKSPNHPDYQGLPQEQQAARDRLAIHQHKLPQFPRSLPDRVVAPQALAMDKTGQKILGYTMPLLKGTEVLLKYGERSFRQTGINAQTVVQIFQDLHTTISKLHFAGIIIGDFNDLNVLVKETEAYLIDADSWQFGAFPCQVFTARFVDPLLCQPQANQPILQNPHNQVSDWYAFTVMLMQCLLFVDPYGGVYKPKVASQQVPHAARSLHRITVFHPEVRYPKPAIPYQVLSDDLLHYFQQVFERDRRGEFPRSLLDRLHWTTCKACGLEHARSVCPICTPVITEIVKPMCVVRGTVTATQLFITEGVILATTVEQGQLKWIYHDQGQFKREDGSVILQGDLNPYLRWRIQGKTTLLGYQGQVIRFHPNQAPERFAVESLGALPLFDVTPKHCYWISNGQLQRDGHLGPTYIGEVLPEQTQFWVGSNFGFGFYQAGDLKVAFVFDAEKPGIYDRVKLPHWQGQLIHANCTVSQDHAWLFLTTQSQGQLHYYCIVIHRDGTTIASAQVPAGDNHWLATLGNYLTGGESQYCAVSNFLLAATDDGIIRIEAQQQQLSQTKAFPDTEPFVNGNSRLLPSPEGLYVINYRELRCLKMN
jgi:H/ACA ribonucleoprotein complex subunit 3